MGLGVSMSIDWGSAPAWVAAAGGVITLALSVRVAWVQVADRRQEQDDRRIAQARLVTAWVDATQASAKMIARTIVRNSSEQAVYNLAVALAVEVRGRYTKYHGALGPGDTWEHVFHLAGYPRGELTAPTVSFTDASGLDWIRTDDGQLRHPADDDWSTYLTEESGAFDTIEARDASAQAIKLQLEQREQ